MPFDGSGNFNRNFPPGGWQGDATANIKIKADRHDQHDGDFAQGLSNVICRDGQSSISADIPWNGKKITGLANPVNAQDAATKNYVDALKNFSTGIVMSGAGNSTRIEYTQADMSFFVRSIGDPAVEDTTPRFVWNDKGDGTGNDIMRLSDASILSLISKEAGALAGPYLNLYRNNATPAVSDYLGCIRFSGTDSLGASVTYGEIVPQIVDPASASKDSGIFFRSQVANVLTNRLMVNQVGATVYGNLTVSGGDAITDVVRSPTSILVLAANSSAIYMRPNGSGTSSNQTIFYDYGYVNMPGTTSSTPGLRVEKAYNNYSIDARGSTENGAIIGYCNNTSYYGICGFQDTGGAAWSFYGSGNARISGGTWQTSDGRFKEVTGDLSGVTALAHVMAIPIRSYKPAAKSAAALGLNPGEEVIGWLAQEVEPVVPVAVKNITPPKRDSTSRAALKKIDMPEEDSAEAVALGKENLTFKATNDHYMLATLWAAVQELTGQVESLKAQLAGAP